jgi:molecular chaperone GrpE
LANLEEMKKKFTKNEDKNELLKNQLARALADYDNLKKRVEAEREIFDQLATVKVFNRLLPVFDMFEHVQKHLKDSGLAMAMMELRAKIKEEGIEPIEPKAHAPFDEKLHEAVEIVNEKGFENGEITELLLTGWRVKDGRVIRPAKVKVNKKEGKEKHE